MTQTTINLEGLKNLIIPSEDDNFHVYTLKYFYVDCNHEFTTEVVAESDDEAMSEAEHFLKFSNAGAAKKNLRKAGNYVETVFVENNKSKTIGYVKM